MNSEIQNIFQRNTDNKTNLSIKKPGKNHSVESETMPKMMELVASGALEPFVGLMVTFI